MATQTDKPAISQAKCFRDDLSRIQSLGGKLETKERTGFSAQHVISRALDALERELEAAQA